MKNIRFIFCATIITLFTLSVAKPMESSWVDFMQHNARNPWLLEDSLSTLYALHGVDKGATLLQDYLRQVKMTPELMKNNYDQTILHTAVWWGKPEIVKLVLKALKDPCTFARIQAKGWTALGWAVKFGHVAITVAILQTAKTTDQARELINSGDETALEVAKQYQETAIATILQAYLNYELDSIELNQLIEKSKNASRCTLF